MAAPKLNRELAAKVIALALQAGHEAAAKHFGISTKSVGRYLKLAETDPHLSGVVQTRKLELEAASQGWAFEAAGFMVLGIKKLGQLVAQAKVEQMRDVTGAIKIVGELDITRKALGGGEHPRADRQGQAPQDASGAAVADPSGAPAPAGVH